MGGVGGGAENVHNVQQWATLREKVRSHLQLCPWFLCFLLLIRHLPGLSLIQQQGRGRNESSSGSVSAQGVRGQCDKVALCVSNQCRRPSDEI